MAQKKRKKRKPAFNLKRAIKATDGQVGMVVKKAAMKAAFAPAPQDSAFIDYYLLIDFGFNAGQPFYPNSVQFYSNTKGFLCYKVVDNASLTSLTPILNCDNVKVTWKTATKEAVHVYGMQSK